MKRKKIKHIAMILLAAFAVSMFAACGTQSEDTITGGVTDKTDPDAPTEIKSKEIADFHADICPYGEWSKDRTDHMYTFEIKKDDEGILTAYETSTGVSIAADDELLKAVQNVIDENGLSQMNGYYRVTAGLPPVFDPILFEVNYASGEKLSFTENNTPDEIWEKELYLTFANWFAANGDDSLLPPVSDGRVERLTIQFTDNGLKTRCGTWKEQKDGAVGEEYRHVEKSVYATEKELTLMDKRVDIPDDYYDRLTDIINSYDIRAFDNSSALYGMGRDMTDGDDEEDYKKILQLHITFEGGHKVHIDTSNTDDIEQLRPLINDLMAYYDELF